MYLLFELLGFLQEDSAFIEMDLTGRFFLAVTRGIVVVFVRSLPRSAMI